MNSFYQFFQKIFNQILRYKWNISSAFLLFGFKFLHRHQHFLLPEIMWNSDKNAADIDILPWHITWQLKSSTWGPGHAQVTKGSKGGQEWTTHRLFTNSVPEGSISNELANLHEDVDSFCYAIEPYRLCVVWIFVKVRDDP